MSRLAAGGWSGAALVLSQAAALGMVLAANVRGSETENRAGIPGGVLWSKTNGNIRVAPEMQTVSARYCFTNSSNAPIEVADVKLDCDCGNAKWSRDAIPNGKTGFVEILYKVKVAKGDQQAHAVVAFQDGQRQVISTTLNVSAPVAVAPPNIAMFEAGDNQTVAVNMLRGTEAELGGVWASSDRLQAFGETLETRRRWRIVVRGGLPRDAEEEWIVLSFATARGESWRTFIPVRPRQAQVWDGMLKQATSLLGGRKHE